MEAIFGFMSSILYQNSLLAITGAFLWGIASIVLSPCHLSSIPLVVGVMTGDRDLTMKKAFRFSLLFAVGILAALLVIGLATGIMGRMIGDLGSRINLVFGVALMLGGILLLDLITLNSLPVLAGGQKLAASIWGGLIVGFLFGFALGPCAFAFMAPVLGLALSIMAERLWLAISLFLAFAVGHCLVIILAGSSIGWVRNLLSWNERSRGLLITKKACGVLVIVAGIYLFYKGLH
jgi:cytochrome c-type biogenesis protein